TPLNLRHTYYGGPIHPSRNEAESFRYVDKKWKKLPETDMSIPGGAGSIVSTPHDLIHFIRALFHGKVVSDSSLQQMMHIQNSIGMGLMAIPFYDLQALGHGGSIDGFQSMLGYFPEKDVAFAFTGNGINYNANDMYIGLLSIYFGRSFELPSFEK